MAERIMQWDAKYLYLPKISNRNPTTLDRDEIGTLWVNKLTNGAFILSSITNNISNWLTLGGATGTFATLIATTNGVTATLGNIVATAGNIVATAGNISTTAGSITSATTVTATLGNITTTNGNFVAATAGTGFKLGAAGPIIVTGAGAPGALVQPAGSLYLNTTGNTVATRLYISAGAGTWVAITTVS